MLDLSAVRFQIDSMVAQQADGGTAAFEARVLATGCTTGCYYYCMYYRNYYYWTSSSSSSSSLPDIQ